MNKSLISPIPKREVGYSLTAQIFSSGGSFISALILFRMLGAEGFGVYTVCYISLLVGRNVLTSAILVPMSTLSNDYNSAKTKSYIEFGFAASIIFSISLSVVSAILLIAAAAKFDGLWGIGLVGPVVVAIFINLIADYIRRHLIITGHHATSSAIEIVRQISHISALTISTAIYDRIQISTAFYFVALSGFCSLIPLPILLQRRWMVRPSWSPEIMRDYWNITRWTLPSTLLESLQGNLPLIIVGTVLGEAALGVLRAVQQIANILNLPANALNQLIHSVAARSFASGGLGELSRRMVATSATALIIFVLLGICLVALAQTALFPAIGMQSAFARSALLIYAALNFLLMLRLPLSAVAIATGGARSVATSGALGAITTVILATVCYTWPNALVVPLAQTAGSVVGVSVLAIGVTKMIYLDGRR